MPTPTHVVILVPTDEQHLVNKAVFVTVPSRSVRDAHKSAVESALLAERKHITDFSHALVFDLRNAQRFQAPADGFVRVQIDGQPLPTATEVKRNP